MTEPLAPQNEEITIYKRRNADGSLQELLAYFDQAGNLILSGWDLGGAANASFGRDEYEYWIAVGHASVRRLLLELMREHYAGASAVSSDLMRILDAAGGRYGFSNWSEAEATESLQQRNDG